MYRHLAALCVLTCCLLGCRDGDVTHRTGEVPPPHAGILTISVDSLTNWLTSRTASTPLLLDARRNAVDAPYGDEALRVDPEETDFVFLENVPHHAPIVVFGSEALCRRLLEAGFTNVVLVDETPETERSFWPSWL